MEYVVPMDAGRAVSGRTLYLYSEVIVTGKTSDPLPLGGVTPVT